MCVSVVDIFSLVYTLDFQFFSEPQWKDILPTVQPPYQKPYTLILSIDDLLVTSTWDVCLYLPSFIMYKLT